MKVRISAKIPSGDHRATHGRGRSIVAEMKIHREKEKTKKMIRAEAREEEIR